MTVRSASAEELQYFRTDGQHSQLYLAFPQPATVFRAKVNSPGGPAKLVKDMIVSVPYDSVTFGAYTSIIPNMTLLVGSDYGMHDLGIARIRKAASSTMLHIGETSEVRFADNVYLTVIDEYGLWPRHKFVQSGTKHIDYMDRDIVYTDQHELLDPVPVLGPDRVLFYQGALGGANTIATSMDGSGSYCLGSSISAYAWTAPGASAAGGLNTATPTFTYNAPGTYRITCQVTAANGKSFTGRRVIVVYDDTAQPVSDFKLLSCSGSYESGGWSFKVAMYDNAALGLVRDRARVILFARDWYGNTEISVGPILGCENIIACGWIDKEDLDLDIDGGTASFTAYGPNRWLNQMEGFISGLRHSETAPTEWNYMLDLTIDKGLWDLLHWRTTATVMMDVILTGSLQLVPTMESAAIGSLWEQLVGMAKTTILAAVCCDRYGRLFVEVSGQYVPVAERAFVNVMTVESYDRTGEIELERATVDPTSMIDLSGVWFDGKTGYAVRALSTGHIFNRYGRVEIIDKLIVEDQAHCSALAALVLVQRNNEYPRMRIELASNMRLIDICPEQQLYVETSTDMNPREIAVSNSVFVRSVSFVLDDESKSISVEVDGEPETTEVANAVPGTIPIIVPPPVFPVPVWPIPPFPPIPLIPPIPPIPKPPPPLPTDCLDGAGPTGPYRSAWDRRWIDGNPITPETRKTRLWMLCTIRSATAAYPTLVWFTIRNVGLAYQHLHLYGIDASGARVATGIVSVIRYTEDYETFDMKASFALPSAITVAGFELEIDEGFDSEGATIETPVFEAVEEEYGSSWATVTRPAEYYPLSVNGAMFYWGGDTFGYDGDWYYQARIRMNVHFAVVAGQHSKIWMAMHFIITGGVDGIGGNGIPLGPDYGPGVGNWAYYGPETYFIEFIGDDSIDASWYAGSSQTTFDNPCTRGAPVHVEGQLILMATDEQPVVRSAGLGYVALVNICPA